MKLKNRSWLKVPSPRSPKKALACAAPRNRYTKAKAIPMNR
jgi:hypothetical protein